MWNNQAVEICLSLKNLICKHCTALYSYVQHFTSFYSLKQLYITFYKIVQPSVHPCTTMYRLVQPLPTFYSHVQPCKTKHNLAQPCCSLVRLCTTLDGMVQNTKEIWISPRFYAKNFQYIIIFLLKPFCNWS